MKKILVLCVFFISTLSFSQHKKILIEYAFQMEGEFLDEKMKRDPMSVKVLEGVEEKANKATFKLLFENNISIFKSLDEMPMDNPGGNIELARILTGQNSIYIRNIDKNTLIINKEFDGTIYNINLPQDLKWEISSETKNINGYECYKATTNDSRRNGELAAWFCPKLPYPVGPIEYGNLPGLILELQINRIKYMATKIDIDYQGPLKFEIPKGKSIQADEMGNRVKKVSEERMNFRP